MKRRVKKSTCEVYEGPTWSFFICNIYPICSKLRALLNEKCKNNLVKLHDVLSISCICKRWHSNHTSKSTIPPKELQAHSPMLDTLIILNEKDIEKEQGEGRHS